MDVIEAIEKRRSIRKFTDKEVKKEDLKELIRLATLAPSAHNRQPWRFKIVSKDDKKQIVNFIYDYCSATCDDSFKTAPFTASVIDNANSLIIIMREKEESWNFHDTLSIGAAIENMTLGALSLGLGTLWINDTDCVKDKITKYLGYGSLELVSVLAVGYPDQSPNARPRKKIEEVFFE